MKRIALGLTMMIAIYGEGFAQAPEIIEKNGHHALLVDGKPYFILGGQAHNSSAWPSTLPSVWASIETMHANTLEVPIYWEQIEPQQGRFNFSLIDTLLVQARAHKVRLVLLWFGTWKNGSNHYMPAWMKKDGEKYPNISGIQSKPIDSPSPIAITTMEADKKAFANIMHHLKRADPQHTVIMIQVENEPGAWGSARDYSEAAQKLFEGPVPAALLKKGVLNALQANALTSGIPATSGTWKEVFGDRADEYFQAWYVARYIDQVAAAGKAEYALPMYVNVALRDPFGNPPATNYESGGATDNVIPIWKAAAKSIDLLAPDIYLDGSKTILKVIELYDRPDNALFVPEAALIVEKTKYLYAVLADGGIGFAPFGIDDNGGRIPAEKVAKYLAPFGQEYAVLNAMMTPLAQWSFEGNIKAVVEREDHAAQTVDLGSWEAKVSFGKGERDILHPNDPPTGKLMIIPLSDDQFILVGNLCHITFSGSGPNVGKPWQYLKVEEGYFKNGTFHAQRILNGDETDWGGPGFGEKTSVLEVTLIAR